MNHDIGGHRGGSGRIGGAEPEPGIVSIQMGMKLPRGGAAFHHGITGGFVDLQDSVHAFHVQNDSALLGNDQTAQGHPRPHGYEGRLFPACKSDDRLNFLDRPGQNDIIG
ncbi:MAG: hypothetical protein A4E72_00506 [Syntrophus sp. PtaU1.Bin208]|nr:MAG: hypothetical protein A4E72_00506 [Syntrophus sp. PtaU1.Bin208]